MVDFIFILEDKEDVEFMRDFLIKNYCSTDTSFCNEIHEKEFEVTIEEKIIRIVTTAVENKCDTGSWNKIKNLIASSYFMKQLSENPKVSFFTFFDGDESTSANIEHKETEIKKSLVGKEYNINRFYLPFNNNESQNLEQLLNLCKTKKIDDCWKEFEICITEDNSDAEKIKDSKGKKIIYREFYKKFANKKNQFLSEIWEIDATKNNNLKPLNSFIKDILK